MFSNCSSHKCSIGLISGDCGGVFKCTGVLSCMNTKLFSTPIFSALECRWVFKILKHLAIHRSVNQMQFTHTCSPKHTLNHHHVLLSAVSSEVFILFISFFFSPHCKVSIGAKNIKFALIREDDTIPKLHRCFYVTMCELQSIPFYSLHSRNISFDLFCHDNLEFARNDVQYLKIQRC